MKVFIFACLVAVALAKHVSEHDYVMLSPRFSVMKIVNLLLYAKVADTDNNDLRLILLPWNLNQ